MTDNKPNEIQNNQEVEKILTLVYDYGYNKQQLEPHYSTQAVNAHNKSREAVISAVTELVQEKLNLEHLISQMKNILDETANALKGEPKENTMHSWHDLPEVATELAKNIDDYQVAADKLAGEAKVLRDNLHRLDTAHVNLSKSYHALEVDCRKFENKCYKTEVESKVTFDHMKDVIAARDSQIAQLKLKLGEVASGEYDRLSSDKKWYHKESLKEQLK